MSRYPDVLWRGTRRPRLDDDGGHGRHCRLDIMARRPGPFKAAPDPMAGNPVKSGAGRRRRVLDHRRRHRAFDDQRFRPAPSPRQARRQQARSSGKPIAGGEIWFASSELLCRSDDWPNPDVSDDDRRARARPVAMPVAVSAVMKMSAPAVAMMTPAAVAATPTVAVAPAPAVSAPARSAPAVGTPAADPAGLFDSALIVDDALRDAGGQRRGLRGRQTRAGGETVPAAAAAEIMKRFMASPFMASPPVAFGRTSS